MNILEDLKIQFREGNIITKLIFSNVFLFVIPEIVTALLKLSKVDFNYFDFVALPSDTKIFISHFWTIITYNFFHSGIIHLLFNMIALYFIGNLFISFFTQKQLFSVYLLGGIFAGFLYIFGYNFLPLLSGVSTLLVGASASVMALLFTTVTYHPFMNVRLALIGNVKLWHIGLLYLFLDLVQLPIENTGGHIAHLGGALFGFIYIKALAAGTDLGKPLNNFLDRLANFFTRKPSTPFKAVHKNTGSKTQNTTSNSKIVTKDKTQQQIDEILDKISKSGYDSLTKEEKEFLFKQGK